MYDEHDAFNSDTTKLNTPQGRLNIQEKRKQNKKIPRIKRA